MVLGYFNIATLTFKFDSVPPPLFWGWWENVQNGAEQFDCALIGVSPDQTAQQREAGK